MSDFHGMDVEDVLDQRFEDIDDLESQMSPSEINAYLANQIAGGDEEEVTLDLDKVREIFEYACEQEFEIDEWWALVETPGFDEFWEALEVMVRSYMRAEGIIY